MATIRSVFAPGQTFNVLDPNAWVGGVVPGPNDIAQIGENGNFYTQINMSSPYNINDAELSHLKPWTGSLDMIRVDDNNVIWDGTYEFPDTDGSFLVYPQRNHSDLVVPIKIDYVSKSLSNDDFFYTCSIDHSYSNWVYKVSASANPTHEMFPTEVVAIIQDNNMVFPLETKFELTGSDVWHVGQIEPLERCHFTIKDNAHIKFDGSTVNPNGIYNQQDAERTVFRFIDNCTVEVTGSTQRSNSMFRLYDRRNYHRIQISGSDTCPHTLLSENTSLGSSIIKLDNPTNFGVGSIISIDTPVQVEYINPLINNNLNPYNGYSFLEYPTGSSVGPSTYPNTRTTSSILNDEVVRVISQSSSDEFLVAKLFGKEGEIIQDFGTFDYNTFVETFNVTPEVFSGNKRAVLVRSLHNDFQKGEILAISRSLVTKCLYADYYLTESKNIDFTAGDTLEDNLIYSPYVYSGSFVDSTFKAGAYYDEYYRWENNLLYGPRTGSSGEVTSSVYLRTDNDYIYNNNNPRTRAQVMVSGSYFKEGEITVVYDYNRNLTGSYDGGAVLETNIGYHPGAYAAWKGTSRLRGIFQPCKKILLTSNYISVVANGQVGDGYDSIVGQEEILGEEYPSKIEAKITHKKGKTDFYINGTHITTQLGESSLAPIMLSLYRYVNLYSINIKDYHQLVLLDTDESVGVGDEVLEGARLEYDHFQGQRVRTNANSIKDIRGYKNLLHDWLDKKGKSNILPYLHGYVSSRSNKYDYNNLLGGDRSVGGELVYTNSKLGWNLQGDYIKGGNNFFVYDLVSEVEFDSLSFRYYLDYNYDYNQMNDVQIEVSNDIENWTTVYGPTSDSRYTTRLGQYRFYDFPEGSVNARFIRLTLNGSTQSTSNALSDLGIHHFNERGNSIELYDASMFSVGDQVVFADVKNGGIRTRYDRSYYPLQWSIIPGVTSGTTTDDDVCGGLTLKYTITEINDNIITVDRRIANTTLTKDTLVYKWNQGSVNFKGNHKNLYQFAIDRTYDATNTFQIVNANFDHVGDDIYLSSARILFSEFENCSVNNVGQDSVNFGINSAKNNIIIGSANLRTGYSLYPGSYDAVYFNNFVYGNGSFLPYQYIRDVKTQVNRYNISLSSYTSNWGSNMRSPSKIFYSKIYYQHNYFSSRYDPILDPNTLYYSHTNAINSIIINDNYTTRGYQGYSNTYSDTNASREYASSMLYANPNLEPFKDYKSLSNDGGMNSLYLDAGLRVGDNRDIMNTKYYPYDSIIKMPIVNLSTTYNNSTIYKEAPSKYGVFSRYPQGSTAYELFNFYHCDFLVEKEQEINIQLFFDYFITKHKIYDRSHDNTNINRGAYTLGYNYFKLLLVNHQTSIILDKEDLGATLYTNFSYNKNHTLKPGNYTFGFKYNTSIRENYKIFEHGPISFNIFSTDPDHLIVLHNNFDAYKLLDTRGYAINDIFTNDSLGPKTVKRSSNTLPTGKLKFRKVKL